MSSSHKRDRPDSASENSEEEYTHITPFSSTYDISKHDSRLGSQNATNCRPRRTNTKYRTATHGQVGVTQPVRVKKRRHTTTPDNTATRNKRQQLILDEPPRSTSLQTLPSETARWPTNQSIAAQAELAVAPELLKAPTNVLHVEDPAQNSSGSMSNLTLRFGLPFLETSLSDIPTRVAGSLINHWRTWSSGSRTGRDLPMHEGHISNRTRPQTMGPSDSEEDEYATTQYTTIARSRQSKPPSAKRVPSDAPNVEDEQSSISFVNSDASDFSEVSIEEAQEKEEQSRHMRFESPANEQELQLRPVLKEQPPPPQHGHPTARRPYKPNNVLPRNCVRREDSALVWDSRGGQDSSRVSFDNWSDPNFISYEKATRLGFSPLDLPPEHWQLCSTLSGQEDLAQQYIELDIEIKSLKIPRESVYLLVVPSNEIDIILGYYYLSQHEITQRLVAELPSRPKAYAIFSKKPTQEQIRIILEQREERAREARETESRIEADAAARRISRVIGTRDGPQGSAAAVVSMGVYGPTTATAMNNSFHPAMGQHDQPLRRPVHTPTMDSFDRNSIADSSSFRTSFDSSPSNSNCITPATTFDSMPGSATESSFELESLTKLPHRFGDRFKGKEVWKGKGDA